MGTGLTSPLRWYLCVLVLPILTASLLVAGAARVAAPTSVGTDDLQYEIESAASATKGFAGGQPIVLTVTVSQFSAEVDDNTNSIGVLITVPSTLSLGQPTGCLAWSHLICTTAPVLNTQPAVFTIPVNMPPAGAKGGSYVVKLTGSPTAGDGSTIAGAPDADAIAPGASRFAVYGPQFTMTPDAASPGDAVTITATGLPTGVAFAAGWSAGLTPPYAFTSGAQPTTWSVVLQPSDPLGERDLLLYANSTASPVAAIPATETPVITVPDALLVQSRSAEPPQPFQR